MENFEEQERLLLEQLEMVRAKKAQQTQLLKMETKLNEMTETIKLKRTQLQQLQDEICQMENDRVDLKEEIKFYKSKYINKPVEPVIVVPEPEPEPIIEEDEEEPVEEEPVEEDEVIINAIRMLNDKFQQHKDECIFIPAVYGRGYAFHYHNFDTDKTKKGYDGHCALIKHLFNNFDNTQLNILLSNKIFKKDGKIYGWGYESKNGIYKKYFSKDMKLIFH